MRVERHGLKVAQDLAAFVEERALPGTGVEADRFWQGFAGIVADLTPKNRALLARREALQAKIDAWHRAHRDRPHDHEAYKVRTSRSPPKAPTPRSPPSRGRSLSCRSPTRATR
jgi:malate synthase